MKVSSATLLKAYSNDRLSAREAQLRAQFIAWGPVVFQATRVMLKYGILEMLRDSQEGLTAEEIRKRCGLWPAANWCAHRWAGRRPSRGTNGLPQARRHTSPIPSGGASVHRGTPSASGRAPRYSPAPEERSAGTPHPESIVPRPSPRVWRTSFGRSTNKTHRNNLCSF